MVLGPNLLLFSFFVLLLVVVFFFCGVGGLGGPHWGGWVGADLGGREFGGGSGRAKKREDLCGREISEREREEAEGVATHRV